MLPDAPEPDRKAPLPLQKAIPSAAPAQAPGYDSLFAFFTRPLEARMDSATRSLWQVNKYLWMALTFALLYIPLAVWRGLLPPSRVWFALFIFVLASGNGAARTWLGYRYGGHFGTLRRNIASYSWAFTIIDILLISLAISISNGTQSDLWLLYFVVVVSESLYAGVGQTRIIALLIVLGYVLGTLPYQLRFQPLNAADYLVTGASRLFFVILIGRYVRRISSNAEERNRELTLLRQQVAVNEERSRIAREVHDGLGHALVSSILRLELCARLIRKAPEEAETLLKEEIPALRSAWNEGRDLAFHLRPWETEAGQDGALVETLRRHIGRFAERTGLVITLKAEQESLNLRPETAFVLMRIVQESLTNVAKHAQATMIEITLEPLPANGLRCTVVDNGVGFDPTADKAGIGLASMRERAANANGALIIESAPNEGTRIILTLPG